MSEINRALEPAIRAEARMDALIAGRAPPVRPYELFPLFHAAGAAVLVGLRYYRFHRHVQWQRFTRGTLLCTCGALLAVLFFAVRGRSFPAGGAVLLCAAGVGAVMAYKRWVPITAHDGRGPPQ